MPSSEANLIPITRRSHLHTRDDLEDLPVFDMVQAGIVKNEQGNEEQVRQRDELPWGISIGSGGRLARAGGGHSRSAE